MTQDAVPRVKKRIGFLSFGHWHPSSQSRTNSGRDALVQSIELAVAAEELGIDGAFYRVHHFARPTSSRFPLLAAIGARTSRIEIGTGVIDMRYENPLYMAEEAASADLISAHAGGEGRLQLGVSRGSPETALDGAHSFGFIPPEGETDADLARAKTELFRAAISARGWRRRPSCIPCTTGDLPARAAVTRTRRPDLVGQRLPRDRGVGRRAGHEPHELDAAHRGHRRPVRPAPG